ncbi:MAG: hypothetical protein FWH17_10200 [Oscillospiraceae bacterium]|nr:hypothetical protein [Oscillospiraceae bacterium]
MSQMLYGMLCSQSCHLSTIGRALAETISLKKTIDRLSRNLSEFSEGVRLFENYIKKVKMGKRICKRDGGNFESIELFEKTF